MVLVDGVEMLDVREAARLAGRTPETVRRWVWSGRLPSTRQGNRLLVARRDVINLLEGVPAQPPLDLAAWVELVDEHRRRGELPPPVPGASAADLVLADRRSRAEG